MIELTIGETIGETTETEEMIGMIVILDEAVVTATMTAVLSTIVIAVTIDPVVIMAAMTGEISNRAENLLTKNITNRATIPQRGVTIPEATM